MGIKIVVLIESLHHFIEASHPLVVKSQKLSDRDNRGKDQNKQGKLPMCLALVVDDDPTQQLIISKLLKRIGLDVIVANDGVEALERVQSISPALVILDILMPRMNGYEVCQRLKSNEKTQHLPVLMYSGQEQEFNALIKGNKPGADAYLSKLCHHQELLNTIYQLLPKKKKSVPLTEGITT